MECTNEIGPSTSVESRVTDQLEENVSKFQLEEINKLLGSNSSKNHESHLISIDRVDNSMIINWVDNVCTPKPEDIVPINLCGDDSTIKSTAKQKNSGESKNNVFQNSKRLQLKEDIEFQRATISSGSQGSENYDSLEELCKSLLEYHYVSSPLSEMNEVPKAAPEVPQNQGLEQSEEEVPTIKQSKKKKRSRKSNKKVKNVSNATNALEGRSYLEILSSINENLLPKMSELRIASHPLNETVPVQDKAEEPQAILKRRRGKSSMVKLSNNLKPHYLGNFCEPTSGDNSFRSEGGDNSYDDINVTPNNKSEGSAKKRVRKKKDDTFDEYMAKQDVKEGLSNKTLTQGELRINPRNWKHAYLSDQENGQDIIIVGLKDRNRALEGDIVVVEVKEKDQWFNLGSGLTQRSGKVVYIEEFVHNRVCVGNIKSRENNYVVLCPTDRRVPNLHVPLLSLPSFIAQNPDQFMNELFLARLTSWSKPYFAIGIIDEHIGKKGHIDAETEGILLSLGLEKNPVNEALYKSLPKYPFEIKQKEIDSRLDLRKICIFSIDPETARDLDDAVSIERLGNDNYRVGVHISDVSHFIDWGTPLDRIVSERATTIYLTQKVIHMLPVDLCMMCSLLPGQDKLAFSVIWRMNSVGEIFETKFSRSVINSCCQLSYEDAQDVIEGRGLSKKKVYNGFTNKHLEEAILLLQKIAVNLREKRFHGGALRIDQPKIWFSLDSSYLPTGIGISELKDSNRLIEEFMLLANVSVAEVLLKAYPKLAFLRRHSPPKQNMMEKLEQSLHKLGIFLDISSSGQLHQSIWHHATDPLRMRVLNLLCSKPMNKAEYHCTGEHHHYALNVPHYTHFTSPIRRFADIVVHRLLAAHLGSSPLPSWTVEDLAGYAANCNKKKYAAKRAGELSSELYLSLYLRSIGEVEVKAVVFNISSQSFFAQVLDFAYNVKVYIENLDAKVEYVANDLASSLLIEWNNTSHREKVVQIIQVFSEVTLLLKPLPDALCMTAELVIPEPKCRVNFSGGS